MSNNNEIVAVLRQALEALQGSGYYDTTQQREAITSLRRAIAEAAVAEQHKKQSAQHCVPHGEPVAWQYTTNFYNPNKDNGKRLSYSLGFAQVHAIPDTIEPLYTNPQPKFGVCL
jgi:hypothetical protein